jgi:putative transposase
MRQQHLAAQASARHDVPDGAGGRRRIWLAVTPTPPASTRSGSVTAPRSPRPRASCSWLRYWTGSRRIVGFGRGAGDGRGGARRAGGRVACCIPIGEYTAGTVRAACARLGVTQSMGRPGSWHSTLEFELRAVEDFATKAEARVRIAAWIDEYNRSRPHSALGMLSPIDYELAQRHDSATERRDPWSLRGHQAEAATPPLPTRPTPRERTGPPLRPHGRCASLTRLPLRAALDLSCTGLVPRRGDGGDPVEDGAGLGGDLWGGGDRVPADVDADGP